MLRSTLLSLLLLGCAARRSGDAVGGFGFEFEGGRGDTGLTAVLTRPNPRALKNAMTHPAARWQAFYAPGFIEPSWLNRDLLDSDAFRIEVYYANQGYFDARFLGWEIRHKSPEGKLLQRVRVVGHVEEGKPSRLRGDIALTGIEKLGRPLQRRLRSVAPFRKGDIFTLEAYQGALATLRATLFDRSYAHARLDGRVEAHPDEHAVDVTIDVVAGPACRFGAVTFEGLEKVPRDVVEKLVEVREGEPFSTEKLALTRSQLYALHVFGVVDIVPDLSDPASAVVPVRVQVKESKFRELRAGPVFEAETGKIALMAQANYRDENLAGRLWRMEQDTRAGVGVLVPSFSALKDVTPADIKPVVDVKGTVELPHLLGGDWAQLNEGRVEVGLEPAYTYFATSFAPSVVYAGFKKLRLSVGYRIRYYDYSDFIDLSVIEDSPLGLDLTDPYLISMLEQKAVYDGRNDPTKTTRGWYLSGALTEAGTFDEGNFSFLRAIGEVRAYRNILSLGKAKWDPEVVLAGRIGGGVIFPYGQPGGAEPSAPYAERLYLGGSNTVRGWAANRLGPIVRTEDLVDFGGTLDKASYPAGGELQIYGNAEIRKGLPLGLVGVAFVDAGRVWDKPASINFGGIQWSVGGGIRYGTPVGPIRLDVGVRLGDDPLFAEEPRIAWHLSLAEAF
ncbi:MAG: BamA/TamA family outer membrane protein [Pseudomonadota bacterium]|nr:BamA/TamA family outer membrane protein [Pseudomonadota bacterium]